MKKSMMYSFFLIGLFTSCSYDNSDNTILDDPGFSLKISGDIEKTISDSVAYFVTGSEPDIFGEDYNFTSFSAVDQGNGQVSFGIITYDNIGKGTYPMEFRLAPELYNGYINFVENPTVSPVYGPMGGIIILKSLNKDMISGSLDVICQETDSKKTISIKGGFTAIRQ